VGFHPLLKVHRQKLVSYVIVGFHPLLKVHCLKFVRSFLWLSFRCPGTRTTSRVTTEPAEQLARPGAEIDRQVPVTFLQKAAFKLFFDDNQAQKKAPAEREPVKVEMARRYEAPYYLDRFKRAGILN
jgi:hypothetical protein